MGLVVFSQISLIASNELVARGEERGGARGRERGEFHHENFENRNAENFRRDNFRREGEWNRGNWNEGGNTVIVPESPQVIQLPEDPNQQDNQEY